MSMMSGSHGDSLRDILGDLRTPDSGALVPAARRLRCGYTLGKKDLT